MLYRVSPCASLVATTMFAVMSPCRGQARLIVDVETKRAAPSPVSIHTGDESSIVRLKNSFLFVAASAEHPRSLVALDPAASAVTLVMPHYEYPGEAWFRIVRLGATRALFSLRNESVGDVVAVTDGTAQNTHVLRPLGPGGMRQCVALGSRVLFNDSHTSTGNELHVSDGTVQGTKLLVDLSPGPGSSDPTFLGVNPAGTHVLVRARLANSFWALLSSDGTVAGTTVIAMVDATTTPAAWLDANRFVFAATDGNGTEPWISDGTTAGTRPLADLNPGSGSSTPTNFIAFKSRVLFHAAPSTGSVRTIYSTDGKSLSELLTRDDYKTTVAFFEEPTVCQERLFFRCNLPTTGEELYVTDGTAAGTLLFEDLSPGPGGSLPRQLTASGSSLYLSAFRAATIELHVVHATSSSIEVLSLDGGSPSYLTPIARNSLACIATDGQTGSILYTNDGTIHGSVRHDVFGILLATVGSNPLGFVSVGGRALFMATKARGLPVLWSTDGSAECSSPLSVPQPTLWQFSTSVGAHVLYLVQTGRLTYDLWSTDGTTIGTRLAVKDVNYSLLSHVGHGRALIFGPGSAIRWTDGTPKGTFLLPPYYAGTSFAASPENDDGVFAMFARDELWFSDGSVLGTRKAFHMGNALAIRRVHEMVPLRNGWFFTAETAAEGLEPWFTDGTVGGTFLLRDIFTGPYDSSIRDVCVQDGRVWFSANDWIHGAELWVSDGTTAGTRIVVDAVPGFVGFDPGMLTAVGTHTLYMRGNMGANGMELYRLDTRSNVLSLAADINPGPAHGVWPSLWSREDSACVVNNDLMFGADDGVHGPEPYAFRHGATATKFGRACGMGSLECDLDPHLGSAVTWRFSSRGKGRGHHVLLVGTPDFEGVPLGDGCFLNIDPTGVIPIVVHGTEAWSTTVLVPNDPSLVDVTVAWQVLSLDLRTHRYGSSNAVQWTFGR